MTPSAGLLHGFAAVRRPGAWIAAALLLACAWAWAGRWTPWHSQLVLLMASYGIAFALMGALAARPRALSLGTLALAAAASAALAGVVAATVVGAVDGALSRGLQAWVVDALAGAAFAAVLAAAVIARHYLVGRRGRAEAERQARRLEHESHLKQMAEMKLKALQAQIEPHFLHNTLANVQHLVRSDPPRADRMLANLIAYLKSSVPRMEGGASTVAEELERVEAYLAIMQVRMAGRLAYEVDVPREARALPLPPLSLVTLVENSVKHGLEPRPRGGRIRVVGQLEGDALLLTVADDGVGFSRETGGGVGLANLRERLAALHGAQASLDLSQDPQGGVEATLVIPLRGVPALED